MMYSWLCGAPRLLSLMQQESLRLSVQQVIIQRCCRPLPAWTSYSDPAEPDFGPGQNLQGVFGVASLSAALQQHARERMCPLGIPETHPSDPGSESETSVEDHHSTTSSSLFSTSPPSSQSTSPSSAFSSSSSSTSSSLPFLLTPSTLSFLKSRSPLLAALACLSASRRESPRAPSSGWSGYFRSGRREAVVDAEQISREADTLLKEFPVLRAYLHAMAEPVLGGSAGGPGEGEEGVASLGAALCGKALVSLLLSGPQEEAAQAVAAEAFQKALTSSDLCRALSLLEIYGQSCGQEGVLRDQLLACAALEGEHVCPLSLEPSDFYFLFLTFFISPLDRD